MIFVDNISELQYYNPPPNGLCYCELVLVPQEVLLQGFFAPNFAPYTISLQVYSADGITVLENATSLFSVYFAVDPYTKQHYFVARLNQWANSMCNEKCFILRVGVTTSNGVLVFDKYTERYCQSDCCQTAGDIDVTLNGDTTTINGNPIDSGNYEDLLTDCGDALIQLTSRDDCYSVFSRKFYGSPSTVIQGSADFNYILKTTMKGRFIPRPSEVTREISYNCKLQRVESTQVYLLEGYEFFPPWKMLELQAQLSSEFIYVTTTKGTSRYEYGGGVALSKPQGTPDCVEVFKLQAELQDCRLRQVFGCGEPCDTATYGGYDTVFIIPDGVVTSFYDESKSFVGTDLQDLLDYLRNLDGMTAADVIAFSPVSPSPTAECSYYALIGIAGNAYIPTSIYFNEAIPSNRVFGVSFENASDICGLLPTQCATPELTIVASNPTCDTPTLSFVSESILPEDVPITAYGNWTITTMDTEAAYYNNQVTFSIHVTNTSIIPSDPSGVEFSEEIIGYIGAAARPSTVKILDNTNNGLTDEQVITIDQYGVIRYTGEPTTYNVGVSVEIEFTNLVYNIP